MELKEGMYVRTIEGIYQLPKKGYELQEHLKYYNDFYINGNWFEKASYNKIDLIEENDVIVIRLHGNLSKHEVSRLGGISDLGISLQIMDNIVFKTLEELTIISVLTHEQFSANEYIFED